MGKKGTITVDFTGVRINGAKPLPASAFIQEATGLERFDRPWIWRYEEDEILVWLQNPRIGRYGLFIDLEIQVHSPDRLDPKFIQPGVNINGTATERRLVDRLDEYFGATYHWPHVLNVTFERGRQAHTQDSVALDYTDVDETTHAAMYRVPSLVLEGLPNAIWGDGGTGKSWVAQWLQVCVALGLPFLGKPTTPGNSLYIDYDSIGGGGKKSWRKRIRRMLEGQDLEMPRGRLHYFDPGGIPLHNLVERLKAIIRKDDIGWAIVENAARACSGSVNADEEANALYRSLAQLGITPLLIGHVTKTGRDLHKQIGTAFWFDNPRNGWSVTATEDGRTLHVVLHHEKPNEGPREPDIGISFTFTGGEYTGPVVVDTEDPEPRTPTGKTAKGLYVRLKWVFKKNGPQELDALTQQLFPDDEPGSDVYIGHRAQVRSRCNDGRKKKEVRKYVKRGRELWYFTSPMQRKLGIGKEQKASG